MEVLLPEPSSDPAPPENQLVPHNGRNIPDAILALCDGKHLAVYHYKENGSDRTKFWRGLC
eukprot:5479343-Lingulodinium_polyedra.AAC.1